MYYLRRKIQLSTELIRRVSTTDCSFSQSVVSMYELYTKDSAAFKLDNKSIAMKIIRGELLFCGTHWKDLDHVVMPVHVSSASHWILVHFDVLSRCLTVYDSMSGPRHESYIVPVVRAFSVMIPLMLEASGFYSRSDINLDVAPYDVVESSPLSFVIAIGTPQQSDWLVIYFFFFMFIFCFVLYFLIC